MQDLNAFYNWMIHSAGITESTAYHYKSGLSACAKDFIKWQLVDKPLYEMSISEFDVAIAKAFLSSNFIEKNSRGKRMYSNSLKQYRNFLASNNGMLLDTKYEQFIDSNVSETDRIALINARVGQGVFRENILMKYNGTCIITGIDDKRLLLASHVRPWAVSSNTQRLSSENGLLLSPLYDKLFDVGLITFDNTSRMVFAKELSRKSIDRLHIDERQTYNLFFSIHGHRLLQKANQDILE